MSLNIMVDIDEVICPLGDSIHELGREAGLHDGSQPWSSWQAWEQYGCSPDAYWDLWVTFAARGGYVNTPPIEHQATALRHLYFDGHTINLVTARGFFSNGDDIKKWTPEWLEEWAIPYHTLTFTKDKAGAQADLGRFDLAIDDSPTNFKNLHEDGVNVFLQDHPHNRWFETDRRVATLWQFVLEADRLART